MPPPNQPDHAVIGVDEPYAIADRTPGQIVLRHAETRGGVVTVPCPCHDRECVTFPAGKAAIIMVCRACLLAYTVALQHPASGPPIARIIQRDTRIHLSRTRR